jgi:CheY-specific phosphatase CheX
MSTSVTVETLSEVAAQVLEDVAFVFTEPAQAASPWSGGAIEATLAFSGPEQGALFVRASPGLAALFAANMLGIEIDDPEVTERAKDAVGEMLNVVAGSLVARVFGTSALVHLGVPQVRASTEPDPTLSPFSVALMTDEGERLELQILAGDA